jgi:hypothetical protein
MSERKEQEKIKKIREYILKSGFPSEIDIGNVLRKSGWLVGNQWPYMDKVTKKIRTVDVLAMKMTLQPPGLGLLLLIECKKGEKHEWVFHTQQKEREFLPLIGTIVDFVKKLAKPPLSSKLEKLASDAALGKLFGLEPSSSDSLGKLSGLHILDKAIKIGVLSVIPSSKDDFFEATQQIISSLESMAEGMKSFIIFPVIVFDGEIYEFYQENNEIKVLPTNHIQFMSFGEDMSPCLIDIVRKTYFSEFLKIIERDYQILLNLLKT